MRTLSATLLAAQQDSSFDVRLRLTLSKAGESDIVLEQDRIYDIPLDEEQEDSQKLEVIFNNYDWYFTDLDLKGWTAVMEWGLVTSAGAEYSALPPLTVMSQQMASVPGYLDCQLSMVGNPDLLALQKADDEYRHHWSDPKTVKDMITEIADGKAVDTELTEQQTTNDSNVNMYSGSTYAVAQRVTISRTVTKLAFHLKKTGIPPGTTVEFRITDINVGSTLATKTFAIADIAYSSAWCEVTLTTPLVLDKEVELWCIYNNGDISNYITARTQSTNVKANEYLVTLNGGLVADTAKDCAYKYKYIGTGIGVFEYLHDLGYAYFVVYDTEDGLIDTYQPIDGYGITEDESRLSAIKRLLAYTKCVGRWEDDGKFHIFVPTISGDTWATGTTYAENDYVQPSTPNYNFTYQCTTAGTSHAATEPTWPTTAGGTVNDNGIVWTAVAFDSEYSIDSGHTFFGKSVVEGLVVPNKVVVHSFPEDVNQYTGSATDAASYALNPFLQTIKAKLSSSAQAASIAKAMIAQYQVSAARGSSRVPINLGSEVFDYIKVTDSRQDDRRIGNIGYLKRAYKSGAGDAKDDWVMTVSMGKIAQRRMLGTQLSMLHMQEKIEDPFVTYGFLKGELDAIWTGAGVDNFGGINELIAELDKTNTSLLNTLTLVKDLAEGRFESIQLIPTKLTATKEGQLLYAEDTNKLVFNDGTGEKTVTST